MPDQLSVPIERKSGPSSTKVTRIRPKFDRFRKTLVRAPQLGRTQSSVRPNWDPTRPITVDFDQLVVDFDQTWIETDIDRRWTDFGEIEAQL